MQNNHIEKTIKFSTAIGKKGELLCMLHKGCQGNNTCTFPGSQTYTNATFLSLIFLLEISTKNLLQTCEFFVIHLVNSFFTAHITEFTKLATYKKAVFFFLLQKL